MSSEQKEEVNISAIVKSMLALHEELHKDNEKLKKKRKEYKKLVDKCKLYMCSEEIDSFDTSKYEIVNKKRKKAPALNEKFIESTLMEFSQNNNLDSGWCSKASEYITTSRKKKSVDDSSIQVKKKRVKTAKSKVVDLTDSASAVEA